MGGRAARDLRRAAFLEGDTLNSRRSSGVHGDGVLEAIEDFIGGVLQAGVGLVELASRLGSELTELITIGYVGECSKDKI